MFIYLGLCWVFVAACGLSRVAVHGPHCGGSSCCGAWPLGCVGFISCSTWTLLLCCMWDLPRPGIKPMSPALAGILSTTGPPGKSLLIPFFRKRNGGSGRLCDLSRGREEEFKHKFDENYKPHFCLDAGEHENLQGYSVITLCAFTFLLRKHFYRKTPALSELN